MNGKDLKGTIPKTGENALTYSELMNRVYHGCMRSLPGHMMGRGLLGLLLALGEILRIDIHDFFLQGDNDGDWSCRARCPSRPREARALPHLLRGLGPRGLRLPSRSGRGVCNSGAWLWAHKSACNTSRSLGAKKSGFRHAYRARKLGARY